MSCESVICLNMFHQASAQQALELHEKELEAGFPLSVLISNPERKKGRTDQDADQREIHVAGLPRTTTSDDLRKIFKEVCCFISRHI